MKLILSLKNIGRSFFMYDSVYPSVARNITCAKFLRFSLAHAFRKPTNPVKEKAEFLYFSD